MCLTGTFRVLVWSAILYLLTLSLSAENNFPACPEAEPKGGANCNLGIGEPCSYRYAAMRTVHCHCAGPVWDCGPPTSMDVSADTGTCPAEVPRPGQKCGLLKRDSGSNRPGCIYEVPATPVTRDCFCAHFLNPERTRWDCGQRTGNSPYDAKMCPWRQPAQDSLCRPTKARECQYGFNLSTTCRCLAFGGQDALFQWKCETAKQPPAPRN